MTTMCSDYASQKPRSAPGATTAAPAAPPRPLSPTEVARVADNKAFVQEHLPDALPLFKALFAEGLVEGWRSWDNCHLRES